MKKRISLLVAIVMLFSSVAVLATPEVEYAWYDEDDSKFYVFGTYTNDVANGVYYKAKDVGVYLNGEKYTYLQEGITVPALTDVAKFGFEFAGSKNSLDEFKVQPYVVNNFGEHKGAVKELDFTADNNTGSELKVSNNANLASVAINRDIAGGVNIKTVMSPSFDPDITEYTVYGYYGAANASLRSLEFFVTTEDPDAIVDDSEEDYYGAITAAGAFGATSTFNNATGEYNNYKIITVTAPNGESKEYRFNFHCDDSYNQSGSNVVYTTINTYAGEKYDNGDYTAAPNVAQKLRTYGYPAKGLDTTQYTLITFPVSPSMATAKAINLNTGTLVFNNMYNIKNLVIATRAYDSETKLGDVCGKFVIPDTDDFMAKSANIQLTLDVTDIVKAAANADKDSVTIAVQMYDMEAEDCSNAPEIVWNYLANSNNYRTNLSISMD